VRRSSIERRPRLFALLAIAVLIALCVRPPGAGADPAPGATGATGVTLTLNSLNPPSPDAQNLSQPVTFAVTITNDTDTTYTGVTLGLQRGLPITQPKLLDAAISHPPDTSYDVADPLPLGQSLPAHHSLRVSYTTTPELMCMCYSGVYPYALVVHADGSGGSVEIARQQVLVPSFLSTPAPVQVAWVWPLLDRPHRTLSSDVFTDDSLAAEVAAGGRLDRALKTAELVKDKVRLALVVDPDLLDSLAVMASKSGYQVRKGDALVAGTGSAAAARWLARFMALEASDDVVLTPFADPDVDALTRAGMTWSTALDPQVKERISPYLTGVAADPLFSWPAGGTLTNNTLDALVGSGSGAVLLSDAALPSNDDGSPPSEGLAPLPSAVGGAVALVADRGVTAAADKVFSASADPAASGSAGAAAEAAVNAQTLLSQLAVRAAHDPSASHFVVVAPDRYVDPDPDVAAATMLAVDHTGWSASISVPQALATVTPVDRGSLRSAAATPPAEVTTATLDALRAVQQQVSSLNDALGNDGAAELLAGFSGGIQRAESVAWRADRAGGAAALAAVQASMNGLLAQVHLIQPADGTYSGSANQPVVVTVANQLPRPIRVRVSVAPAAGVIGFRSTPIDVQTVPANSNTIISTPTHVDRLGKVQVVATLSTPDGMQLGQPVTLQLHATPIGGVSKTITIVAVTVLGLALLRRLVLRLRRGGPSRPAAGRR